MDWGSVHGIFSVNTLKCSCNIVLILLKYSYGFELCGIQEQAINTVNESDNCLESNLNVVILSSVCDTTLLNELATNKQKSILFLWGKEPENKLIATGSENSSKGI